MKTPDQHLRLIALPAALALVLVGCDKGSGTDKATAKPESSATTSAAATGEKEKAPAVSDNTFTAAVAGEPSKPTTDASASQSTAKNAAESQGESPSR